MKKNQILVALACAFSIAAVAQQKAPDNWFNLDSKRDNVNGVSTEKVYQEILKGKKGQTVVVAVIDGGVDYNHEDLKDIMWVNPREIPNNGIDDDKNGYIDDIHGWNFIGGADGKNVHHETLEITRLYAKLRAKYQNTEASKVASKDKKEYEQYLTIKQEVETKRKEAEEELTGIEGQVKLLEAGLDAVDKKLAGKAFTKENVEALDATGNDNLTIGKGFLTRNYFAKGEKPASIAAVKEAFQEDVKEAIDYYESKAKFQYNPDLDTRKDIVKDNYADSYDRKYGNPDVKGPDAFHGTHVAGIIGAIRNNETGIKGVADNVRIMAVRCVPDGDERDKDVANSIIYAVDNGASVINMSFGKSYTWDKAAVDKAVKYAASKDVLLVHAAGNDAGDNDNGHNNYPKANYEKAGFLKPKKAKNWIEVGALSWKKDADAVAKFSNYGAKNVDVFAPGVDIYSTTPEGKYKNASGTSMASPVTAGVAAMIRSYYPELTADQVKECIEKSVVKQDYQVKKPGSSILVKFSELCQTGGTVNAFEAVKLASQMKGKKKINKKA